MNRPKMPVWFLAGGLIILQMILVAVIVHGESPTFDEADHIFAGYMMWHSGDYGRFCRYARQTSAIRLLLTGLAAGLALASKHGGILLAPMLLALTLVEIACTERGRRGHVADCLVDSQPS